MRQGRLPPPLNLLQLWPVLHNDWLASSRISLLVSTLLIAPIAIAFHWAMLLLATPALILLTLSWGHRGFYDQQQQRLVPDHRRAAREVLEKLGLLALMLPLNLLLSELRAAIDRWRPFGSIEPGEWVHALNTTTHSIEVCRVTWWDQSDKAGEFLLDTPIKGRATTMATSYREELSHEFGFGWSSNIWLVLGRLGMVSDADLAAAKKWSLDRARNSAQVNKAGSGEAAATNVPTTAGGPTLSIWEAKLEDLLRSFEISAITEAMERADEASSVDEKAMRGWKGRFSAGERVFADDYQVKNARDFKMAVTSIEADDETDVKAVCSYVEFNAFDDKPKTVVLSIRSLYRWSELDIRPTAFMQLISKALEPTPGMTEEADGDDEEDDIPTGDALELNSRQTLHRLLKMNEGLVRDVAGLKKQLKALRAPPTAPPAPSISVSGVATHGKQGLEPSQTTSSTTLSPRFDEDASQHPASQQPGASQTAAAQPAAPAAAPAAQPAAAQQQVVAQSRAPPPAYAAYDA